MKDTIIIKICREVGEQELTADLTLTPLAFQGLMPVDEIIGGAVKRMRDQMDETEAALLITHHQSLVTAP